MEDSRSGRGFSDVSTLPLGKILVGRAQQLLKRGGRVDADLPVIFSPRATAAIVEALAELFSADEVNRGRAFLFRMGRLSEKLHLLDMTARTPVVFGQGRLMNAGFRLFR